eukprot:m.464011 g.464011  ORF g.464011 m.464011 type:complete len:304 (+) comp20355_c0_seq29:263-1174(+)
MAFDKRLDVLYGGVEPGATEQQGGHEAKEVTTDVAEAQAPGLVGRWEHCLHHGEVPALCFRVVLAKLTHLWLVVKPKGSAQGQCMQRANVNGHGAHLPGNVAAHLLVHEMPARPRVAVPKAAGQPDAKPNPLRPRRSPALRVALVLGLPEPCQLSGNPLCRQVLLAQHFGRKGRIGQRHRTRGSLVLLVLLLVVLLGCRHGNGGGGGGGGGGECCGARCCLLRCLRVWSELLFQIMPTWFVTTTVGCRCKSGARVCCCVRVICVQCVCVEISTVCVMCLCDSLALCRWPVLSSPIAAGRFALR